MKSLYISCTLPLFLVCLVAFSSESQAFHLPGSKASTTIGTLRGGGVDISSTAAVASSPDVVAEAVDWITSLATPAALVSGGILTTLIENPEMKENKSDKNWASNIKKLYYLLLCTGFGLELLSIFSTVLCTSSLLKHGHSYATGSSTSNTALALLQNHFEVDFLRTIVPFLQGLLHWLCALSVKFVVPQKEDGPVTSKMNRFLAAFMFTLTIYIKTILDKHLKFYPSYFAVMRRWVVLTIQDIDLLTVNSMVLLPSGMLTLVLGIQAIKAKTDDSENGNKDKNPTS